MARTPRKDIRRHERIPCKLSVLLAWIGEDGSDRYARGRCRDVSASGLRIETVDTIPQQSYVNLRIEKWDLTGSGRVRYTRRGGVANIVGLELHEKIHQELLDRLRVSPEGS
jgi:hypothetical protein